jgi:hypothetical protein
MVTKKNTEPKCVVKTQGIESASNEIIVANFSKSRERNGQPSV